MLEFLEGPKNKITIEEATISELKLALAGKDGRSWFPVILLMILNISYTKSKYTLFMLENHK
ncbi:MAG: hypothetical protein ACLR2G_08750 [Phascolarctobacterium faecium]